MAIFRLFWSPPFWDVAKKVKFWCLNIKILLGFPKSPGYKHHNRMGYWNLESKQLGIQEEIFETQFSDSISILDFEAKINVSDLFYAW